jgi:S1-C subfamily serine protease
MFNRRSLATWAIGLGSFAAGLATQLLVDSRTVAVAQGSSPLPPPPTTLNSDRPAAPDADRFEQIIRRVSPAVIAVDALKPAVAQPGSARTKPKEESGSGVIVRLDGFRGCYAITNNHVIGAAPPGDVFVTLADGRILRPERIWTDPPSDVAILKLPHDDLPTAPLADSDRARVGQWVLAFGSPFGLNQTVTHGIISARDRGQISLGDTIRIKEFLQTDAAINPGSSGGPLVDLAGAVVGINTAIASNNGNNSGVSFSIPTNLVRRVAGELLTKGAVSRGYLGIQLAPGFEPATALRLGLNRVWGAVVESVYPDGPAARGGIRPGDVILRIDDVEIRDENHLINLISTLPADRRVRVGVWRDRQVQTVPVMVADWTTAVGRNR